MIYITHSHSSYEYTHQPYNYEHFLRLDWQILKIDKVTIDVSLLMEISSITEGITLLNSRIFFSMKSLTQNQLMSLL